MLVDYVGQTLDEQYPGLTTKTTEAVEVYTTLDLHLQRLAQDAVRDGLTRVDELLARRKRRGKAEAALISVDPRTGEILAFVGGRSYNQSQYNRAIVSRRQPGSVFKPFVYLTAFEEARKEGRTDVTPATIVDDEPETFEFDDQVWEPANYENRVLTVRSRSAMRSPTRATSRPSTSPQRPATIAWRRCGRSSASAARRRRIRRSRSGCSRRRRTKSRPPIRCSPTSA